MNQKGLTVIEGLIATVVVIIVGFGGYYVWNQNQDDSSTKNEEVSNADSATNDDTADDKTKDRASSTPEGWVEYESKELGFSFAYPEEYGGVNEDSSYGSENENALRYTFYFENICPTCNGDNPFAEDMAAPGIVEIGATTEDFGGIGTGRPYASSAGFDGEGNFEADNGAVGLLSTVEDQMHEKTRTTIVFNLTKSPEATGIMFMTHDEPGETTNADNLESIAATFKLAD